MKRSASSRQTVVTEVGATTKEGIGPSRRRTLPSRAKPCTVLPSPMSSAKMPVSL